MATLVSVPYQPEYKATPDTVALLMRACSIAGHDITLVDAWRSYAEQAYYWDQYINHGGNVAGNPDSGQRNHMRGAAFDIQNTSSVNRNAMLQAGFTPDPDESWHFNNPNWPNMPIIPVDTGETDMLADERNALMNIYNAVFYGGPSMKDGGKSISQSLAEVHAVVTQPVQGRDRGDGNGPVNVSQIQDNADTNTMVRQLIATVGSLQAAVASIAGVTGADPAAIQAAAQAGAEAALKNIKFVAE